MRVYTCRCMCAWRLNVTLFMFIPSFESRFNQFYNLHSHYNYHVYDMDSVFLEATDTDIILVL